MTFRSLEDVIRELSPRAQLRVKERAHELLDALGQEGPCSNRTVAGSRDHNQSQRDPILEQRDIYRICCK